MIKYTYIYIYMYMYICIHVYMYICIYVYIYVYIYICICIYVYMYMYIYMYIYIYVYMYICMYIYMYIYVYIYTYTYVFTSTYLHVYICMYIFGGLLNRGKPRKTWLCIQYSWLHHITSTYICIDVSVTWRTLRFADFMSGSPSSITWIFHPSWMPIIMRHILTGFLTRWSVQFISNMFVK